MNRLVIIGNGFDLAHGLPTSYKNFIDDFWKNLKFNFNKELQKKMVTVNSAYTGIFDFVEVNSFETFKKSIQKYSDNYGKKYNESSVTLHERGSISDLTIIFKFENEFFKTICNKSSDNNWVDVENEYYYQLKKIIKSESLDISKSKEYWSNEQRVQVEKLNQEFEQVKNLLERYLQEKVLNKYNFNMPNINELNKFHNIFYPDILVDLKIESWKENFSKDDKEYINELIKEGKAKDVKLRFLNFNYTPTLSCYFYMNRNLYNNSEYFIHGKLGDANNKINFGFGDEMDEDYKLIENINDNEYLRNFKSFQYFQNDTYKKLLDFVDSEKFEVYIMGSSCGLSDRTLLNAVFENINCRSIKIFYYQKKDGTDNFTELTQNISRHFKDKTLMRSKIVHKSPDQIMPNIQLYLK